MMRHRSMLLLMLGAGTAGAQQLPPIRQLGPVVAKSDAAWANIASVRALPGGRVLVNDFGGRKVVLLDSALATVTVVADTTAATASAYSGRIGGLIPFRADSTLFVDPQSLSMMVIDGSGKITRVMSVPRSEDAGALVGFLGGATAFDGKALIYRAPFRFTRAGPAPTTSSGLPVMPTLPESAAIVRVDLTTRQLDTVGVIKIPKVNMQVTQDDKGNVRMTSEVNPLPLVDDWAVLPGGAVAFLRGRDYHVDFVNADGSKTSAPKVPFEWQRLTDEDKVAFIDSVKAARARLVAASLGTATTAGQPGGAPAPGAGGAPQVMIQMNRAGPEGGRAAPAGGAAPQREVAFVSPSELPDYKPPFFVGAVRSDEEGNLWVRTIPTRQIAGGPVYDVINRKGELVDRVQLPAGRSIVGFAGDGIVYMLSRDGTTQTIERARAK